MFLRPIARPLIPLLVLLGTAPLLAESPTPAEAEAYLGKITKSHGELNTSGQEFGRRLGDALKGGAEEKLALYRTYRTMAKLVFKIQQECNQWTVPDGAESQSVKAANDRFMKYQHDVVLDKLPSVLEIIDDDALDSDAKLEKVKATILRDNEREVELGKEVRRAMAALRAAAK